MATFTMSLAEVVEALDGQLSRVEGNTVLTGCDIGLNDYDIFDDDYRVVLNGMIIDRYINREIGSETIETFVLSLRRKMNENMGYFNSLYESQKIIYDPLSTINLRTISSNESSQNMVNNGTSNATSDNTSKARSVSSATPQTMLQGSGDYATSATDSNGESAAISEAVEESTQNATGEVSGETEITGYQGIASDLIMRYRQSLININLMILAEIEDCFMLVWDNGDSYTKGYVL